MIGEFHFIYIDNKRGKKARISEAEKLAKQTNIRCAVTKAKPQLPLVISYTTFTGRIKDLIPLTHKQSFQQKSEQAMWPNGLHNNRKILRTRVQSPIQNGFLTFNSAMVKTTII